MKRWQSGQRRHWRICLRLNLLFEVFALPQRLLLSSLYAAEVGFVIPSKLIMAETNRIAAFRHLPEVVHVQLLYRGGTCRKKD